MGKDKLVTVDQLQTVAAKLKELIDNKPDSNSNAEFSSVTIGNTTFTVDLDGKIKYADEQDNTGNLIVDNIIDQDVSVNSITADKICDYNTDMSGSSRTVYSLPTSTAATRLESFGGGGTILTSKYRSYQVSTRTIGTGMGMSILVSPFVYSIIKVAEDVPSFNLAFMADPNSPCDEWWADITFGTTNESGYIIPDGNEHTPTQPNVMFDGELFWVNGEPDWSKMLYKRVRIHVLNNIAEYVVINLNLLEMQ